MHLLWVLLNNFCSFVQLPLSLEGITNNPKRKIGIAEIGIIKNNTVIIFFQVYDLFNGFNIPNA